MRFSKGSTQKNNKITSSAEQTAGITVKGWCDILISLLLSIKKALKTGSNR